LRILSARETAWFNIGPDTTWDSIQRLEDWPRWCDGLIEARWRFGEPWTVGSRFSLDWGVAADSPLAGGVILEVDGAPEQEEGSLRSISWVAGIGPARSEAQLMILQDGSGSLVEFVTSWKGWASPLFRNRATRCANRQRDWLASLREILERVGSSG